MMRPNIADVSFPEGLRT